MAKKKERELLLSLSKKDFEIQTFRSSGPGGQNVNKVESGVRLIHHPSGARGESREERDQPKNKKNAFLRLIKTKEFKAWHRMEVARKMGILADIERQVNDAMHPRHLKLEVQQNGRWVEIRWDELIEATVADFDLESL